ncbi:MAG: phage virion morphogenesis protein, partial [Defluviicoccus sp.]|nr:phage virion morphogenesis protein [Defluviicoccus sp.]
MAGSGAALEVRIDSAGLAQLQERLDRLARALRPAELQDMLEGLAAEVETQTRRRISEERTSPNGEKWPEWEPSYAKTRHGNQSLLMGEGDLLDSIQSAVDGGVAET